MRWDAVSAVAGIVGVAIAIAAYMHQTRPNTPSPVQPQPAAIVSEASAPAVKQSSNTPSQVEPQPENSDSTPSAPVVTQSPDTLSQVEPAATPGPSAPAIAPPPETTAVTPAPLAASVPVSWKVEVVGEHCTVGVRGAERGSAEYERALADGRAECAKRMPPWKIEPDYNARKCRTRIARHLTGYERESAERDAKAACDRAMGIR
jgi:hypothetical protein